jgi:hypothetical protein
MELTDFRWQERQGRDMNDEAFHEWTYQHGSGRLVATISGPIDKRGGFTHSVVFLFSQNITMAGSPFIFTDFDAGKRFVEGVIAAKIENASPEGLLEVARPADPMQEMVKQITGAGLAMLLKGSADPVAPPALPASAG